MRAYPASLVFASLLFSAAAATAAPADFTGRWEGAVSGPEGEFRLAYVIQSEGDGFKGVLQIPEFGDFSMQDLKIEGNSIAFHVESDAGTWSHRGTLADAAISVTVEGPEGSFPLVMKRPASAAGRWHTKVQGPDGDMELVFTFRIEGENLAGSVNGPWGEAPIVAGTVKGNALTWDTEFQGTRIHHTGTLEGDTITGQVSSPDWEFPLKLTREKATPAGS